MTFTAQIKQDFGTFTLDVDFQAPPGLTVLFGKSGSGKTSVINAAAGLLKPQSGRMSHDDQILFDTAHGIWLPPHKRRIGYIFQEARLFPHLTVEKNLYYGARFAPKQANGPKFDDVVQLLGIGHLLARRPTHLSGGEQQRVAIGRALLSKPNMLLADEPLAALDENRKLEILPYFERLRDETAIPILYVSHSASEVARLATTVVVLENGRVTHQGPATEILSDPNVTPTGPGDAGAVLQAIVIRHHDDGLSELDAQGLRFLVPRVSATIGSDVRVRIQAQDVMLAKTRPQGISALNVLPAQVREIRLGGGPGALVQLTTGQNTLLSRVTRRSVDAMALSQGMNLFAVIKAVSVAKSDGG